MATHPSQSESNAMAAFLAASDGDLVERARLWNEVVKSIEENLAGGSKDGQPKNED